MKALKEKCDGVFKYLDEVIDFKDTSTWVSLK